MRLRRTNVSCHQLFGVLMTTTRQSSERKLSLHKRSEQSGRNKSGVNGGLVQRRRLPLNDFVGSWAPVDGQTGHTIGIEVRGQIANDVRGAGSGGLTTTRTMTSTGDIEGGRRGASESTGTATRRDRTPVGMANLTDTTSIPIAMGSSLTDTTSIPDARGSRRRARPSNYMTRSPRRPEHPRSRRTTS